MDNSEFEALVLSMCPETYDDDRFPMAHYSEIGNSSELFFSDEPHYGDRINDRLTLYIGQETGDVVGMLISLVRDDRS